MMTHIHDFTIRISPSIRHILEKLAIPCIPLPLFMLFAGTEGIIEKNSPENLANLGSLSSSFFNFFGMHTLIIAGAFGITLIIWFVTKNIWSSSDDDMEDEFYENDSPSDNQVTEQHKTIDQKSDILNKTTL